MATHSHSLAVIATIAALLATPARVSAFVAAPPPHAAAAPAGSCTRRKGSGWSLKSAASGMTAGGGADIASADEAKTNLKKLLKKNFMRTGTEDVQAAVETLGKFNPTTEPGRAWHLLNGKWDTIGQEFPGTTHTPEGFECTLGRLAFDIFEPTNLPIRIVEIVNDVRGPNSIDSSDDDGRDLFNIVTTRFCARDGSGLRGKIVIKVSCVSDPENPQRLLLCFYSGTIEPDDGQDLDAWSKTIGLPSDSAEGGKPNKSVSKLFARLKKKAATFMLKLAFGFKPPASELGSRGELTYDMTRSPKGWLDVLYLDEEMRVTRGNRGSVVVVARM